MSGSSAADGANATMDFDSSFPDLAGAVVGEFAAPTTAGPVNVTSSTFGSATITGGEATFNIDITIRIGNNLTVDNYGGYSVTRTVTVNDGV